MNEIIVRREKTHLGYPGAAGLIRKAAERTLEAEGIREKCMISVLLTDDEGIHRANLEFRQTDSVTDVLSFPMSELTPGAFRAEDCEKDLDTGSLFLGDILIDLARCAQQGEEFGHGFSREVQYLTTHSVLHLLGYDHTDEGVMKEQMRRREKEIMGET